MACRDVVRRFGNTIALDRMTLSVARGDILAIVGPDGAGKTTLLRIICGVLAPDSGEVDLLGVDMIRDPEAGKARLGYMPQRFSLYSDLTGRENLRFYADLYDVPPDELLARSRAMLDDFRLESFVDIPSGSLSGGMKQKLALACTLVHEPELLVLDEPTAGVDPVSRRQFWRLLYGLNSRGVSIVVSTPYMDEAQHATHVALMHRGRLIAFDTPSRLKAIVASRVVEIGGASPAAVRRALRTVPIVQSLEVFGGVFHALVPDATQAFPVLRAALEAEGVAGASLRAVEPLLEDAFIWLLVRETASASS
ncbi:MAG TPA: ABC transporter ATP-binding protein [Candidatus Eremiobacteraceae bacterium]|nr:ABC transporter ATP-binding protein [Candidatus Eremiobacteraceae bacterium]